MKLEIQKLSYKILSGKIEKYSKIRMKFQVDVVNAKTWKLMRKISSSKEFFCKTSVSYTIFIRFFTLFVIFFAKVFKKVLKTITNHIHFLHKLIL